MHTPVQMAYKEVGFGTIVFLGIFAIVLIGRLVHDNLSSYLPFGNKLDLFMIIIALTFHCLSVGMQRSWLWYKSFWEIGYVGIR